MEGPKNSNDNQPETTSNEIKFDILKIDSKIKKDSRYEEGESIFEFCQEYNPDNPDESEQKIDFPKYFAKIKTSNYEYLGILSKNLKKENYGYNHFDNGDEYFGQWNKDKKEGYGIYFFKNEERKNFDAINQVYVGEFKNNMKSGEGIYFSISEFSKEKIENKIVYKPLNFNLVVGNFIEDNFTKGIIYSMQDGKRKIYRGKLNKEGKKEDNNGELYEDKDKIFFGTIKDNVMIEGRIVIMKDDIKENGYYFNKKGKNVIDGEVAFEYLKDEENDDIYIKKMIELNNAFNNEKIQELFVNIMEIREKGNNSENNFEYIKKINYDSDVKQILKNQYGKYLYC